MDEEKRVEIDQADAADPLRGLALPRARLHRRRPGVPQRPVRVLRAAAEPGRRAAGAVRRVQLPPAPAGEGGRRLRRRGARPSVPTSSSAAATDADDGGSTRMLIGGGGRAARAPRRWRRRGRSVAGQPRRSASERRAGVTTLITAAGATDRSPGDGATPGTSAAKLLGALGSLFFVLVVNFFLFRVLPGDPARTLGRGRFRTAGAAGDVPAAPTGSTRACRSSSSPS